MGMNDKEIYQDQSGYSMKETTALEYIHVYYQHLILIYM